MGSSDGLPQHRVVGRYVLYGEIASGGMATVHFGRMLGSVGFSKTVAIKRLHENYARDPEFVSMFLDEARLAARIQHPNVVSTLDVETTDAELFLVMEYVKGESFSRLMRTARKRGEQIPPRIVATIVSGLLHGLHAAHEAVDEHGQALGIVHRDVSPQNVLVGSDGVARVLDFGVAKAAGRLSSTRDGQLKGKFAYMAPEQVRGGAVDRRSDVYAAAVVLWEALTGRRMVEGDNDALVLTRVLEGAPSKPSAANPGLPKSLDVVTMRGLELDPNKRYPTAREMAFALERAVGLASQREVGEWVERAAVDALALRAMRIKEIESRSSAMLVRPDLPGASRDGSAATGPAAWSAPGEMIAAASGVTQPGTNPSAVSEVALSTSGAADALRPEAPSGPVTRLEPPAAAMPLDGSSSQRGPSGVVLGLFAGAAVVFALVAVVALVLLWRAPASSGAPAAGASAAALAASSPSNATSASTPPASASVVAAPPSSSAAAPAVATASASAWASGSTSAAAERPPAAPSAKSSTAKTSTASAANDRGAGKGGAAAPTAANTQTPKAADCDVPFTIDAQGVKRPKPQCM